MMFVPTGRPINPVTHANWEGVGLAPDTAVTTDDAPDVAQIAVLSGLAGRERDPTWKAKLEQQIAELK